MGTYTERNKSHIVMTANPVLLNSNVELLAIRPPHILGVFTGMLFVTVSPG